MILLSVPEHANIFSLDINIGYIREPLACISVYTDPFIYLFFNWRFLNFQTKVISLDSM